MCYVSTPNLSFRDLARSMELRRVVQQDFEYLWQGLVEVRDELQNAIDTRDVPWNMLVKTIWFSINIFGACTYTRYICDAQHRLYMPTSLNNKPSQPLRCVSQVQGLEAYIKACADKESEYKDFLVRANLKWYFVDPLWKNQMDLAFDQKGNVLLFCAINCR